ncbi:MAG: aromatic ring-hydroxylating dioxygenase subunit alpha [Deltaproteobacteria bacterium]|nr:aromatic ring-hydroxylating dioxygenase subunit alpha [Deltaproteobacteria bacterium]
MLPSGSWIAVGRLEDLPEPGAWLLAPITPAGVLVTRDDDGDLRAFHAVCTHRGSALFDEGAPAEGTAQETPFTCPYHGMQFGLDGAPCGGPEVVRRTSPPPLREVRVDDAFGFVFVTLDDGAPPLEEAVGEAPPWLGRAEHVANGRLRRVRRVAYDVAARASIVLENFQESLHFASVHPALEALTPSALAETWRPTAEGDPWLGGIMPIVETAETVSTSTRRSGRPFLVPEEDRRVVHDAMRAPNLLTSLQPDYLLTFVVFPQGEGRTRIVASTYVHPEAPEASFEDVTTFWDRVYDEDKRACERQERGLRSGGTQRFTNVEEGAEAVARQRPRHCGIFGRPYADLSDLLDTSSFPELHREITRGLAEVETSYTGGTLKWMGVCAPWVMRDPYRDAMHAIREMTREELEELVALGDHEVDLDDPEARTFGDETDRPFSMAQMKLLEQRHGVYFPWKVCYHLLENDRWEDKHSGEGKDFTAEARRVFPKTVKFIEGLPFTEVGRVVLFGLLPNDHAPSHRDSEPGKSLSIAQSISFEPCPVKTRKKRFYLTTPDGSEDLEVDASIYWFNDMDWHGVKADPWFRYSIRVDGVFEPDFLEHIRRVCRQRAG